MNVLEKVYTKNIIELSPYASFRKRFAAGLIDEGICISLVFLISVYLFYYSIPILVVFFIQPLYYSFFESSKEKETIGKKIMKIYVCKKTFEKVSFLRAFVRNILLHSILGWFFWIIFISKRKQMLHDVVCSTVVLNGKKIY